MTPSTLADGVFATGGGTEGELRLVLNAGVIAAFVPHEKSSPPKQTGETPVACEGPESFCLLHFNLSVGCARLSYF